MEQDAFIQELTEGIEDIPTTTDKTDLYGYHMRSEPRDKAEEETFVDEETGRRYQWWNIGMNRNAKQDRKNRTKVILDPIPHVIKDQNVPLRGWYKSKNEPDGVRPRPCYTDAILTQPYGGFCHVGCAFCYINNGTRGYRGQGVSVVDLNYAEKCRRQVKKWSIGQAFYMSSFIDPFMPLEPVYENTKKTAQVAVDFGLPMFFLTRQTVPGWAYDFLKLNKYSYMQFSINTPNPSDWRRLSPKAIPLEAMIEQVREMNRRGIYVSIQVNPIIAGVTSNDEIVELIHILAAAGANHLIFKYVEIVYPSAPALINQMERRFPERAGEFKRLFTQNIGGVKTIDEDYRIAGHDRFLQETKKAGVTMALCYEYKYERDAEGNPKNKTGVSMGGDYLTADQCHGWRVPVFERSPEEIAAGAKFRPIEACPPSGCLTCGDVFKKVPCGIEKLGHAPAWEPKDMITMGQ